MHLRTGTACNTVALRAKNHGAAHWQEMWANQRKALKAAAADKRAGMRWSPEFLNWCLWVMGTCGYSTLDKLREVCGAALPAAAAAKPHATRTPRARVTQVMTLPSGRMLRRYCNR